jgi:hypothetical protein
MRVLGRPSVSSRGRSDLPLSQLYSRVAPYVCVLLDVGSLCRSQDGHMTFTVACNSFKDGDYLPSDFILSSDFGFGCAGRNRSPHLKWSGAPEGTKSFPVTCYDPHAPISVCLATAGPVHPRATIPTAICSPCSR